MDETLKRRRLSSSGAEMVVALIGLVFAILAIAGILPRMFASLSALSIGAALLARGSIITWGLAETAPPSDHTTEARAHAGEAGGDEVLAGTTAAALGIVALVGIEPRLLLAVAAVAAGAAEVMSGSLRTHRFRTEALRIPAGIGAIVLGVLGMIGFSGALTLVSIANALLCAAVILGGAGVAALTLRRT
jgi:hypothetical protein